MEEREAQLASHFSNSFLCSPVRMPGTTMSRACRQWCEKRKEFYSGVHLQRDSSSQTGDVTRRKWRCDDLSHPLPFSHAM